MKSKPPKFFVITRSFFFVFVLLLTCGSLRYSAAPETYYFFVFSNPVAAHDYEYNK
jgi:hypothetical protein